MDWVNVEDRLPEYGEPVLIVVNGVTQNVTYILDGYENEPDWFEPHHFDHDDNLSLRWNKADYWMPLPEPPSESES